MPLRDPFHSPLADLRHWESFHSAWALQIMRQLNREVLPVGCFAEAQVRLGGRVEIDVATFEEERLASAQAANGNSGTVPVEAWAPPATALVMPAVFPDVIEVQVFRMSGGATLVGAIELVSPANKDRPETRRAFVAKCAHYLQQGVGLVIVDVVTERQANLHDELIHFLEQAQTLEFPESTALYATAYRPASLETGEQIEIWLERLTLGQALPIMPLALRGVATVPLDLEATYASSCQDSRL